MKTRPWSLRRRIARCHVPPDSFRRSSDRRRPGRHWRGRSFTNFEYITRRPSYPVTRACNALGKANFPLTPDKLAVPSNARQPPTHHGSHRRSRPSTPEAGPARKVAVGRGTVSRPVAIQEHRLPTSGPRVRITPRSSGLSDCDRTDLLARPETVGRAVQSQPASSRTPAVSSAVALV